MSDAVPKKDDCLDMILSGIPAEPGPAVSGPLKASFLQVVGDNGWKAGTNGAGRDETRRGTISREPRNVLITAAHQNKRTTS